MAEMKTELKLCNLITQQFSYMKAQIPISAYYYSLTFQKEKKPVKTFIFIFLRIFSKFRLSQIWSVRILLAVHSHRNHHHARSAPFLLHN